MAPSILLVEDDRDIRDTLKDALEIEGYEVIGAIDGLDALEQLEAAPAVPDLVLLDLMMPRMNGVEFHAAMVKVDLWKTIPVLVLSADAHARAKVKALGVQFLGKPVKLVELFKAVATMLAR